MSADEQRYYAEPAGRLTATCKHCGTPVMWDPEDKLENGAVEWKHSNGYYGCTASAGRLADDARWQ